MKWYSIMAFGYFKKKHPDAFDKITFVWDPDTDIKQVCVKITLFKTQRRSRVHMISVWKEPTPPF